MRNDLPLIGLVEWEMFPCRRLCAPPTGGNPRHAAMIWTYLLKAAPAFCAFYSGVFSSATNVNGGSYRRYRTASQPNWIFPTFSFVTWRAESHKTSGEITFYWWIVVERLIPPWAAIFLIECLMKNEVCSKFVIFPRQDSGGDKGQSYSSSYELKCWFNGLWSFYNSFPW